MHGRQNWDLAAWGVQCSFPGATPQLPSLDLSTSFLHAGLPLLISDRQGSVEPWSRSIYICVRVHSVISFDMCLFSFIWLRHVLVVAYRIFAL